MATGETRTIDSDLTLTNKYEMTAHDDILNIISATVILAKPAGDLFTNEGNDTVKVTGSTITASALGLSFFLGSGDDKLTLQSSIIAAPTLTGSGHDTVVISGDRQSCVTLNKICDSDEVTLNLGDGDDVLELQAKLEGDGDIRFGTGADTLRFNGGALVTTGTIDSFCCLDVMQAGGSLGLDLTLAGTNTKITLKGSLLGITADKVITITSNAAELTTADNIRTNVAWKLTGVTLTHSDGGTLEFSGHSGYAITADNSTVTLHDIVTQSGQAFTGENTIWTIKDSDFANSTTGISLTGGSIDLNDVGMAGYSNTAMKLNGTKMTGAMLAFTNNQNNGAVSAEKSNIEITDLRMNGNSNVVTSGVICSSVESSVTSYIARGSAYGGGINHKNGDLLITSAIFSGNIASASVGKTYVSGTYIDNLDACAMGGGINLCSGDLTITSAKILGNTACAIASIGTGATAVAYGGGISYSAGNLTITSAVFSGNIVSAFAHATGSMSYWGAYQLWRGHTVYSGSSYVSGEATMQPCGGGIYLAAAVADIKDTSFTDNISNYHGYGYGLGGAIYLSQTTMNYTVTSGKKLANTGNQAECGEFLYMTDNSTANFIIEDKAVLTIGNSSNYDSIGGDGLIQKQGTGYLLINSDISGYNGIWTVYEGTVELARIARTVKLDQWTFGEKGLVILSSLDDSVNMTANKKISTLDLGGGSDVINTNGYALSNGELRISKLKFTGGGRVSSTITNRTADSGFDLTLDDVILDSNISGGNAIDCIYITKASTLGGIISLGGGSDVIKGTADTAFQKSISMGDGSDMLSFTSVTFADLADLGAGNDNFSAENAVFNGKFSTGSGSDTVVIGEESTKTGSIIAAKEIDLGNGVNSITVYGMSDFAGLTGGNGTDTVDLYGESTINGELALGQGKNVVYVENALTMNGTVKMEEGGETRIVVYRGATLTDNTLTVYSDASAERETATMSWANQTELDKVRLVVSSDSTFKTFEFAVEL